MELYVGQFDAGMKYEQHAIEILTISPLFVDRVGHSLWFCYLELGNEASDGCKSEKTR